VRLPPRVGALLTAFGGGILLVAVALELVPEADEGAGTVRTVAGLLAGAAAYVGADAWLTRDDHTAGMRRSGHAAAAGAPMSMPPRRSAEAARGEAIAAGIVVDGVPESLALGLMVAAGDPGLALLAAVVLGNLTESYGAAQPILHGGRSRRFAVGLLAGIGALLAAVTVLGATVGAGAAPAVVGTTQAFAAGAVIAVLSISLIPYTFEAVSRLVAVALALGFTTGYVLS
jgi:zinc transporter, ZIP family